MKTVLFFLYASLLIAQSQQHMSLSSKPYLTITDTPLHSVYISWNTEQSESSIVAYGLTPLLEDTARVKGTHYFHHVELTQLLPGTPYFYRLIPHGIMKTFETFPMCADTFAFVVFGDTRSDSAAHQSIIHRMMDYEFRFLIHTGDLVHHGDNIDEWRTFFNVEDTILQNKHFVPVIGNHEKPFWLYDTLFALPDSEEYYSFNYGNAHVIVLNTETDMGNPQRAWLMNDLATAHYDTCIDWIFVTFHRPAYSSGRHGANTGVQQQWCLLFEEFGVDMVFAGHDHLYERTSGINGVTYIVSGGGGAPLYDAGTSDWTVYSEKTHHFCFVRVMGERLLLKAIKPNGVVFDSLVVVKTTGVR
jgi:hypothetical protein